MRRYLLPVFLLFAACATVPADRLVAEREGSVAGEPHELAAPVRLETRSGTFLVHPNNVEDFGRLLAGEPAQHRYTAGMLLAGE
ncbi:hypothetical protein [Myxococcus sp. Y35]|uniref:hypothetical protein n=1 Tax=Pseudomyxococcus flavus TaxID=3115648 RepID=UPI003CF22568